MTISTCFTLHFRMFTTGIADGQNLNDSKTISEFLQVCQQLRYQNKDHHESRIMIGAPHNQLL